MGDTNGYDETKMATLNYGTQGTLIASIPT